MLHSGCYFVRQKSDVPSALQDCPNFSGFRPAWVLNKQHFPAVEARELEYDRPPTLNPSKKEYPHKSSYIHVATCWSLLQSVTNSITWGLFEVYGTTARC